ncbi:unnamed protein product [Schistosoma intercalatum]|nr:unnamed protein product [Schistosoma intercalatum]
MNVGADFPSAESVDFSYIEYESNYINNSDKSPMIPFMNYQRLFVGLLPSSYLRSSYHRMLRRVIYLCIGITLLLFLWLAFYISDSTWFSRLLQCNYDNKFTGRVSISPDPWSKTRFTHISDNGNINYHHSNNKIKQQIAGVATTKTNYVYGVVFDAGSTGSRVHIFKLVHNPLDPFKPFKLLDDKYHHVQPGLSSYAEKPEEAALSLTKLINIAETSLPVDVCRNTPVILRATAGLRLISAHKAENILKAVRHRLSQTCFKQLPNAVTIMDGFYEGLYLWLTLNFLNNRLSNGKAQKNHAVIENSLTQTIGTLDLGGGSTQITFIPTELNTLNNAPDNFITYFDVQNSNDKPKQKIYSHSYLGLGLMSARYSMLYNATEHFKLITEGKKEFFHPCWPNNVTIKWNHAGKDWQISRMNHSMSKSLLSFIKTKSIYHHQAAIEPVNVNANNIDNDHLMLCYALAVNVLQNPVEGDINVIRYPPNNNIVHQPVEVKTREFYAFSYYFDLAVSVGLIHENTGGFLTVNDFQNAAERVCRNPNPQKPFDCMDLSFITALLHSGYGFPSDKKIGFFKKVNSFEINWSLGALFSEITRFRNILSEMKLDIRDSKSDVGRSACDIIKAILLDSTKDNRIVTIGLSGGSMPHLLAPHLCSFSEINWELVHFFYCDERLVPLDSEDSNHHCYQELLYSKINIPSSNIHTVNTTLSLEDSAADYQKQLLSFFGTANGYPRFDLLLLGMGPDGHTCSLFPDHKLLYSVHQSPNPGPSMPCSLIHPVYGELIWIVDKAAASLLNT